MTHAAPLTELRTKLEASRRREMSFDDAWPPAVELALAGAPRMHRAEWRVALEATRAGWEDAYLGRGPRLELELAGVDDPEPVRNERHVLIR